MSSHYRPILPAQASGQDSDPGGSTGRQKRRSAVLAACVPCQMAKSKCSGERPICHRCTRRNLHCGYDTGPNQTRASSRRLAEEHFRELYALLRSKSWDEALEILRRIRETPNPFEVVPLVQAADVLLRTTLLECNDAATAEPRRPSSQSSSRLRSPSPFPSPWTTITDADMVQDLISVFFDREQGVFMSFIDKDMLLRDMQVARHPFRDRWFCSKLLINAICAITACHYKPSMVMGSLTPRRDFGEAFFSEAKELYNSHDGPHLLSTAQALLIMYSYSCRMGRDRAGHVFRTMSYEIMRNMMPDIQVALVNTADAASSREAILRAIWGIFCFESICSSAYLRPSLLPVPDVPRPLSRVRGEELQRGLEAGGVVQGLHGISGSEYRYKALQLAYDVSEISIKVLEHAAGHSSPGGNGTVSLHLNQLYNELQILRTRFPEEDGYQVEYFPEHCHLWAYYHMVAVNITRLLQHLEPQLSSRLDRLTGVCIRHCRSMIEHVDRQLARSPSERQGSLILVYFAYTVTFTLLTHLDTSLPVVTLFLRACEVLHDASDFPLSSLLLQGLQALANQLDVQLPAEATPYFGSMTSAQSDSVPLGFVVPVHGRLFKPLNDGAWDLEPHDMKSGHA